MHPWHDIPINEPIDAWFPAVIETPAGSRVQYTLDKAMGILRVERILYSSVHYPANYGFIPRTLGGDGEALDVLVLGQHPLEPLSVLRARAIGLMRMTDRAQPDDKIIAVHIDDPVFAGIREITGLPSYRLPEIHRFFEDYRALEKIPSVVGVFEPSEQAHHVIREAMEAYRARWEL